MNLQKVREKLELKRKEQTILKKAIEQLRQTLIEAGENPDLPKLDLVGRNKEIYKRWKDGESFAQLAKAYNKSPTLIHNVCKRIEKALETKNMRFPIYKDMLKYK